MTSAPDMPPANLPIEISEAEVTQFRTEDAGAAKFIGLTLSIMFLYSLIVMVYVYWLTVQSAAS